MFSELMWYFSFCAGHIVYGTKRYTIWSDKHVRGLTIPYTVRRKLFFFPVL